MTSDEFVMALVARFPELRLYYEEHVQEMGELLPHVFFGIGEGFTARVVDAYLRDEIDALNWREVLEFLDTHFDRGDRQVDGVIVTDFLLSMPGPDQPGHGLIDQLPERLRTRFTLVRPSG